MDLVDTIADLLETRGRAMYFGEDVTEAEHALQSAHLAERCDAAGPLVAAALLHDVGHLLHRKGEDVADRGVDAKHETIGHAWLTRFFGPAVAEPVRLHVAAKRYLCAVDKDYLARLSPASNQSLDLQGGPFTEAEVAEFERQPYFADAIRLRHWDDEAKVVGLDVPSFDHYRLLLKTLLSTAGAFGNGNGKPATHNGQGST
jgi:phosphonate degradation associated HDIG domain protein